MRLQYLALCLAALPLSTSFWTPPRRGPTTRRRRPLHWPQAAAAPVPFGAGEEEIQRWTGLTPQGPFSTPGSKRPTLLRELVPGQLWSLEQTQGVIYVHVPVRMTVAKWSQGLVAYSAVAPTKEMLALLAGLEQAHGQLTDVVSLPLSPSVRSPAQPTSYETTS